MILGQLGDFFGKHSTNTYLKELAISQGLVDAETGAIVRNTAAKQSNVAVEESSSVSKGINVSLTESQVIAEGQEAIARQISTNEIKEETVETHNLNKAKETEILLSGKFPKVLGAVAVAVGVVITAYKVYKQYKEELLENAKSAAQELDNEKKSIEDYTSKYQELHQALIAANGDEEETYSIKQQLLELQKELNEKFGEEYGKINLVADAYRNKTEAIKNYNKEIANSFLNEHEVAIEDATKNMEAIEHYTLSYSEIGSDERGKVLKEIAESYADRGIRLLDEIGDRSYAQFSIHLDANAEDAYDTISDFMSDIRYQEELLGEDFSDILELSSSSFNKNKEILDANQETYKKSLLSKIELSPKLSEKYNEMEQAVEDYNDAVLKSSDIYTDENVRKTRDALNQIKNEIEADEKTWGKYSSVVEDVFDQADTRILDFYDNFKNNNELKIAAHNLKVFDEAELESFSDSGLNSSYNKLADAAYEAGLNTSELNDMLISLGYAQEAVARTIDKSVISLDSAKSKATSLTEEYESLKEVLADTKNVSIETYEELIAKSEDATNASEDYSHALKIEAGQVVVDNQKLKMVNKTRTESIKKEVKEASTLKKLEWINNAKRLQQYNFQQNYLNSSIWETCNALQNEINQFDILVQGIDAASNSFTAFQEAQSASESGDYFDTGLEMANEFQKGLETGKIGTPKFLAAMEGFMQEDLFTKIINMDDFKAQADELDKYYDEVISRYYIEGEDADYDASGLVNFATDLASFKDEAGNALYGTYEDGVLKLVDGMDYTQLAKDLNLNLEQIYALFGELEEYTIGDTYNFDNKNLIDDYYDKLSKVTDAQQLYNDALENGSKNQQILAKHMLDTANANYEEWLKGLGDKILGLEQEWQESGESNQSFGEYLKDTYSADEFAVMYSTATERAEELRRKIHELEVSGRSGSTEWKEYNAELEKLDSGISAIDNTAEKQELLNEAVQSTTDRYKRLQEILEELKDPNLDGKSIEKLKQEAYELIAALGELPKSVEIEFKAKATELEEKIDKVNKQKTEFEKRSEQTGTKYSPSYQAQMGEYNAQIREYDQELQEINAILNLDTEKAMAEIEKIKSEDVDKEGEVAYSANFDACKKETPPTLEGVVKYTAKFEPVSGGSLSIPSGGGKNYGSNGVPTTEADGTFNAFATGTQVSIPKNEKALVNELGEEGLVRDGKLIPIKGGAQLLNLKRGDIIFNHKQMEDLKKHGYTTGRGKLIGSNLIGAHFNGTISAYNNEYTGSGGGFIGSNSKYSKVVTNSTRSTSDVSDVIDEAAEETKEVTEEIIDWIIRRIDKLQRYFDRWVNNAESILAKSEMTNGLLAKYYKKASGNLNKQLNTQSKAYSRYLEEADKSGLSDDYKKKVRDGLIDIESITDDTLKEQIQKYQENFDKATDAITAFEEAAEKRFNIPLDKAAKKVEVFGDAIDLLDKKIDNAIGATAKNKLIDKQTKEEENTLKAYKVASKESKKNLKSQGKKMTSSSILNSSDVSSKEKKAIKKAVKNGKEIDISYFEEGSKAYKQAVKYNEALRANQQATQDLANAQEEYNSWLVEAAKTKFDNVATDYENAIKQIQNDFTDIENRISEIESAGKRVHYSYYENQKSLNDAELAQYQAEKIALEEKIKAIKEGTKGWYESKDAIQEVENAISDCVNKTHELNNAITELHYGIFTDIEESIDRIIKEQEFLQGLFAHEKIASDDTGDLTEAGIAKLGSTAINYYANKEKVSYAQDELNILRYMSDNNLLSYSDGVSKIEFNSIEEREKRYKELYDTVQDYITAAYNAECDLYDIMEQKYQAELNYVKQLIEDKKEALQAEKD